MSERPSNQADPGDQREAKARSKAARFAMLGSFAIIIAFLMIALFARLDVFAHGFHLGFALILGVVGTTALGVVLMGLVFYSDRSGADERVLGAEDDEWKTD